MEEKFNKLYVDYYPLIKRYIFNKLSDHEVSEDITHDVFMKVFIAMKNGGYKENGYLKAYLYTLAYNETSNYLGSFHYKKSVTTYKPRPGSWSQISYDYDILEEYCHKETLNQVIEIVNELPDFYRKTFFLVNIDGLKYKEAAKKLGVPTGTVKFRINHCCGVLKEKGFIFYKTKGKKKMIA